MKWLWVVVVVSCSGHSAHRPAAFDQAGCTTACPKNVKSNYFAPPGPYEVCFCQSIAMMIGKAGQYDFQDCYDDCQDKGGVAGFAEVEELCICR